MKSFRDLIKENKIDDFENEGNWSKQDLIDLLTEQDLDDDDIAEITELVIDIVEFGDFDGDDFDDTSFDWDNYDWDDDITEKMTAVAKKDAAKKRKKPAFKKAMRKKKKCMAKHADKIKKSKDSGVSMVCGTDGKIKKGMTRGEKRKLAKTRKKNKNKIIK